MKAFIAFFALVAAVAAEADPVILAAGTYAAAPIVAAATPFTYNYNGVYLKSAPCVNNMNIPQVCAQYNQVAFAPSAAYLGYSLGARLWKRDAEADADAEPVIFYNSLGAPAWAGAYSAKALLAYGLKSAPCVNDNNQAVPCNADFTYYAPITTAAVAAPAVTYTKTIAAPAVVKTVAAAPVLKTVAAVPAVKTIVSQSAPVVTSSVYSAGPLISSLAAPALAAAPVKIVKREADSEADPAYFYSGLPAWNAYSAVNGVYGYPYALASPYNAGAGLIHTSRLGLCLNYVGAQVPC